jgi:hypothetical protein
MVESITNFFLWLNLGDFVGKNDWVWPICEILHFFGMAAIIGTVGLTDARMLGLAKGIPIKALEKFIPLGVIGFLINVVTGVIFIAGNPVGGPREYVTNLALQLKMLLVLIAGINLLLFYVTGIEKKVAGLPADGTAPTGAKVVAIVSLIAWFGVIFMGRLIMYNDTLLYALGL